MPERLFIKLLLVFFFQIPMMKIPFAVSQNNKINRGSIDDIASPKCHLAAS